MKSSAFLTPMAVIMVMIVHDASAERDPQCAWCSNCYFAAKNGCFLILSKEECDSMDGYKWCGAGSNDLLPPPPNDQLPPPQNDLLPSSACSQTNATSP
ncbi:hypothetical protein DYB28_008235 [Aphanomyces astaci]|uniref:Uncharacterized protein n=1 Tax=Aphanomyces astaci TaxID=112090 RepID=A0A9X8H748_APHAT|nr:hypothetical protein DYB28_008235 [Aphanomyces astaci]